MLVVVAPDGIDRHDLNVFDSGRLVEPFLLAADARGVGSNIATLKEDGPDIVKEMLGFRPASGSGPSRRSGYTDEEAHKTRPSGPAPGRKPATEFVHWDRY